MDIPSQMRASKVFNVMLLRLWRKRRAEVCGLQELLRKYQTKTSTMRDNLFRRNQLICREQRRCEHLETELRLVKNASKRELDVARRQQANLRQELRAKAQELYEQQRQNIQLELRNAELEDELLTLKDRFQTQHDNAAVAVHLKQEQLDEPYETLKGYELDLAELQLKHSELLKESHNERMLAEITNADVEPKIGMVRYVISCISPHRWRLLPAQLPNVKQIAYEIAAQFLNYLPHGPFTLSAWQAVGVYLAFVLIRRVL